MSETLHHSHSDRRSTKVHHLPPSTDLVEATRKDIVSFFNTTLSEYDVIFTNNCSGALRIIGESYPFSAKSNYLLASDNHNSVNGIREFAKSKGATVKYLPVEGGDLRLNMDQVTKALASNPPLQVAESTTTSSASSKSDTTPVPPRSLFAFPAQSNFSGVKHPLELVEIAHSHGWDVLLDAAAYAPTSKIDLSILKPEFLTLSFYKMFGYPTGLGALLVKRKKMSALLSSRPWFAGGTVEVALVGAQRHWLHQDHEAFEDGTINFLNIPAISIGLKFLNEKCGGMDVITTRIQCMTSYLLDQLKGLKHAGSSSSSPPLPLVRFYGPSTMESRGGTIALNVIDPEGEYISCWEVDALANERNISIRAGCFCNPGDSEAAFQWDEVQEKAETIESMTKKNFSDTVLVAGAVRISVGVPTIFSDLHACVKLFESFLNCSKQEIGRRVREVSGGKPVGLH